MKLERPDLMALAALLLVPALLWWPLLLGALPDFMDTVVYLYPIRMALAGQIRSGVLPLWNPHMMGGVPLAANPQLATWYPPQLLFYALPGPFMYGLLCILHAAWGGAGTYWFVRHFTRDRMAALFAGIVFVLGPFVVSRLALAPHLYTIAWIPWILLAVERAAGDDRWLPGRSGCLVAVALALQILAGSPQITYYTALVLPVWWLARAMAQQPRTPIGRLVGCTCAHGIVTAISAFSLCGIQLIPTLEFISHTARSAIAPEKLVETALNGDLMWKALIGFTGNPLEDTDSIHAVGLGVIVLAIVAVLSRRTRSVALLLLLSGVFGWLLSIGPLTGLWSMLLPGYDGFHAPRRALVLWSACAPLAAGLGAGVLAMRWTEHGWPRWAFAVLLIPFALGTVWILPRLEREFANPARFDADARVLRQIGNDRFFTIDPTLRWSHGSRDDDFGRSLISNLAPLHGVYDANGYDPLILARMAELRTMASGRAGVWYPSHGVYLPDPMSPLLRVLNAQYFIGRWDLFEPGALIPGATIDHAAVEQVVELVLDDDKWPLWRFKDERPFAWSVEQAFPVPAAEDALHALLRSDGLQRAYVEDFAPPSVALARPQVSAAWRNARTIDVSLDANSNAQAIVCVSVSWMPGWQARTRNGERLDVHPAQGAICGVLVPPGVDGFTMTYAPASFTRGTLLSVVGLLLLLGMWSGFGQQRRGDAPRVGHEGERQPLGG
jgi:hypothetical protein